MNWRGTSIAAFAGTFRILQDLAANEGIPRKVLMVAMSQRFLLSRQAGEPGDGRQQHGLGRVFQLAVLLSRFSLN